LTLPLAVSDDIALEVTGVGLGDEARCLIDRLAGEAERRASIRRHIQPAVLVDGVKCKAPDTCLVGGEPHLPTVAARVGIGLLIAIVILETVAFIIESVDLRHASIWRGKLGVNVDDGRVVRIGIGA